MLLAASTTTTNLNICHYSPWLLHLVAATEKQVTLNLEVSMLKCLSFYRGYLGFRILSCDGDCCRSLAMKIATQVCEGSSGILLESDVMRLVRL